MKSTVVDFIKEAKAWIILVMRERSYG
jgi:hypothetical protein